MRNVVGDVVERRVAVDLVAARREQRVLLVGARRGDRVGADDPDAHALVAAGVDVAGVQQRHPVVGGVQRADVHVVETALAADEDLVERPLGLDGAHADTARCSAAYAVAASRTQAPSSWARRRWAIRCALHGPLPFTPSMNSSQSGWPKSWWPRSSFQTSSGSGRVTPSASAWGTDMSTNFWRSSSLVLRLMPHAIDWAVLGESASGGPNIIR